MPLPANFRTAPGIWIHRDANIGEAVAAGYDRAGRGDWVSGSSAERARAFLGLLVERSMLMGSLAGTIEMFEPGSPVAALINPSPLKGTGGERRELVTALYGTAALFVAGSEQQGHIETDTSVRETGIVIAWPVAAIAIAVVVAGAAAIAYCARQAAEIADRQLSRNEDAQRLANRDAELMKLIREHQEEEQKAGKQLPLNEPQRLALQGLLQQQQAIVSKSDEPFGAGASSSSALFAGFGGVALGVAGGFVLSKIL